MNNKNWHDVMHKKKTKHVYILPGYFGSIFKNAGDFCFFGAKISLAAMRNARPPPKKKGKKRCGAPGCRSQGWEPKVQKNRKGFLFFAKLVADEALKILDRKFEFGNSYQKNGMKNDDFIEGPLNLKTIYIILRKIGNFSCRFKNAILYVPSIQTAKSGTP